MIKKRQKEKNNGRNNKKRKRKIISIILVLILITSIGVAMYVNITVTWIVPSVLPSVTLDDPADGSTVTVLPIQFNWTSTDVDGDPLTNVWYCDISPLFISPFKQIVNVEHNQTYNATLDDGHWYWKVEVSDNDGINISEVWEIYVGENATNSYPYLTNASVHPTNGDTSDTYVYNITFYDADNDTASFVRVYIDGVQYAMNEVDPADTNTSNGKNYTYSTSLSVGTHNYTFTCMDNDAVNITDLYIGPTVSSTTPVQSNEKPSDGAVNIFLQPVCSIQVNDLDGDNMDVNFFSNFSGVWTNYQTNASVGNGTYQWHFVGANTNNIKYWWSVNLTDGLTWNNQTYNFTTITLGAPQQSNEYPNDGAIGISRFQTNVSVYISDINGDLMDWTIEVDNSDSNSGNNNPNGTINCSLSTPLSYSTTYTWWVNITDGIHWFNQTYTFTTQEIVPIFSNPLPSNSSDNICPCCDSMSLNIINRKGNNMNITFYRNDTQFKSFYIVNKIWNIPNGTYSFCIDGHINDSIYYPVRFNETYHWYVNMSDVITGEYNVSDVFVFHTEENISNCSCGGDFVDTIRDDAWLIGVIIAFTSLPLAIALKSKKKKKKKQTEMYPMQFRRNY